MTTTTTRDELPEPHFQRGASLERVRDLAQQLRRCGIKGDLATVIRAAAVLDYLGEWDRAFLIRITPRVQAGLQMSGKQRHQLRRIARDLDALQRRR